MSTNASWALKKGTGTSRRTAYAAVLWSWLGASPLFQQAARRGVFVSCCGLLVALCASAASAAEEDAFPKVGDKAKDFALSTPGGEKVQLASVLKKGPVALVVLRGYPGYQCAACDLQVRDLLQNAEKFQAAKASVLLVYPGPAEQLKQRAEEFVRGKTLPANFDLVLDPDYAFTKLYGLRWNAENETAYPSTFVIDPSGKITFAKTSQTHKGRASAAEVLQALAGK